MKVGGLAGRRIADSDGMTVLTCAATVSLAMVEKYGLLQIARKLVFQRSQHTHAPATARWFLDFMRCL